MSGPDTTLYWSGVLKKIRKQAGLSQGALAELLETDQPTVSRWERRMFVPSPLFQEKLEQCASRFGIATLHDIVAVVKHSPFPMILVSRDMMVMAASVTSGFEAGRTTIEQTPPEERHFLMQFSENISVSGFWDRTIEKLDYEFEIEQQRRRAVVVPVVMQGAVYALVQKAW